MNRSNNNDCRIYIGNLPPGTRDKDLEDIFYKYGHIGEIDLKNKRGGPAFAFVEFDDPRYLMFLIFSDFKLELSQESEFCRTCL